MTSEEFIAYQEQFAKELDDMPPHCAEMIRTLLLAVQVLNVELRVLLSVNQKLLDK
jgi:uncharacterized protein YneF (UPF0154 family)